MVNRKRKHFNKVVRTLSELYNRRYEEVNKLYNQMDGSIENTKAILNLTSINN